MKVGISYLIVKNSLSYFNSLLFRPIIIIQIKSFFHYNYIPMEPFSPNVQVLGQTLLSSIAELPSFARKKMQKVLEEEGVAELDLNAWYDIKIAITFYKQIAKEFGPNTLFDLGKSVPEKAVFPPGIDSLDSGLQSINVAYSMNHRNGYIGFYNIISHDLKEKIVIMHCYTPYPCDFDRGLITAIARKFKTGVKVTIDENKPSKKKGGDESWYIISYR
jgi:hypothetical protein